MLVTHAVDFVHLADHIIIMKNGQIEAQGSYPELMLHPYMVQIQDIHTKNKKEIQEQNERAMAVEEGSLTLEQSKSVQLLNSKVGLFGTKSVESSNSKGDQYTPGMVKQQTQMFISKKRSIALQQKQGEASVEGASQEDVSAAPLPEIQDVDDEDETIEKEEMVKVELTDAQLDEKLDSFKGAAAEVDD